MRGREQSGMGGRASAASEQGKSRAPVPIPLSSCPGSRSAPVPILLQSGELLAALPGLTRQCSLEHLWRSNCYARCFFRKSLKQQGIVVLRLMLLSHVFLNTQRMSLILPLAIIKEKKNPEQCHLGREHHTHSSVTKSRVCFHCLFLLKCTYIYPLTLYEYTSL